MELQVKRLREKKGLTQQEIADALGIALRRYGSWERGDRSMNLEDACAIADVLGCTLDELAGREAPNACATTDAYERELLGCYRASTTARKGRILDTARDNAAMSKDETERAVPQPQGMTA